jgi:hypothetical protein
VEIFPYNQEFGIPSEMVMSSDRITPADVKAARDSFETNEPRDLFYRVATELVDLALRGATSLTVAEALAVLLQTWNKTYYQYRKFDNAHFAEYCAAVGHASRQAGRIPEADDRQP